MQLEFTGRKALVTGGTGGLGADIARELHARGARVAITYRGESSRALPLLAAGIERAYRLDLTSDHDCREVVDSVTSDLGGLNILVHAAGPHVPMTHLSRVTPAQLRWQLDQDPVGFFNVVHPSLAHLRTAKGVIVAVTTAATDRYPVRDGLSAAPKAALEALARGLAAEEGRFGVRVNCVGPGMLTDGMAERLIASGELDDRALQAARSNIPLRRFGTARDITEAVCFLASDRAGFITGQKINVDGGYTL